MVVNTNDSEATARLPGERKQKPTVTTEPAKPKRSLFETIAVVIMVAAILGFLIAMAIAPPTGRLVF